MKFGNCKECGEYKYLKEKNKCVTCLDNSDNVTHIGVSKPPLSIRSEECVDNLVDAFNDRDNIKSTNTKKGDEDYVIYINGDGYDIIDANATNNSFGFGVVNVTRNESLPIMAIHAKITESIADDIVDNALDIISEHKKTDKDLYRFDPHS
jgi:hypothetical protein